MKFTTKLYLLFAITLSFIFSPAETLFATPSTVTDDPLYVESTQVTVKPQKGGKAVLMDGPFTFSTTGTYTTINENLNNGFNVTITDGQGDLQLIGTQTGKLTIDNANKEISIIDGHFTHTTYLSNTNVQFIHTKIDTLDSYGLEVNSHVKLYVDSTSHFKVTNSYASTIIVNNNRLDISMVIDGLLESNQQVIGVDTSSVIDSIIINGELSTTANYGLITTIKSKISYIEFGKTSVGTSPLGMGIYAVYAEAELGDVVFNGKSDVRTLLVTSAKKVNTITFNGMADVVKNAFYLGGEINSLTVTENATIVQKMNDYGLVMANATTNINLIDVRGNLTMSYILIASNATSLIKELNIDPVSLNRSSSVTGLSLIWLGGRVQTLTLSNKVFEVDGMDSPINMSATGIIDHLIVNQSVIDTQYQSNQGIVFNDELLSKIGKLDLNDTLLFGSALNVDVENQAMTHLQPLIQTSNLTNTDGVVTIDVEMPELASKTNLTKQGVKLTFMLEDYSHGFDFMYYGGVATVEIPNELILQNLPIYVVNYAQYNLVDDILLTSNRSMEYTIQTYLLSFNNNGDTSTIETQELVEGSLAKAVPNPTLAGFVFSNWNLKQDGSGSVWNFDTSTMPAQDVTLYAIWDKEYLLEFDLNGIESKAIDSQILTKGATTKSVEVPSHIGYQFKEWNTIKDGSGDVWVPGQTQMIEADVTLYAIWDKEYLLEFDLNGIESKTIDSQILTKGETTKSIEVPSHIGYRFKEWNTIKDGSGDVWVPGQTQMIEADVTLYAIWDTNHYTVQFDLNGLVGNKPLDQIIDYLSYASNPNFDVIKGYTFKGWNTAQDGTGKTWNFSSMAITEDQILYAQWNLNLYPLSFDLNGLKASPIETQMIAFDSLAIEPDLLVSKGYSFIGWNTLKDGSGQYWDFNQNRMEDHEVILYAQWRTHAYQLTFDFNDSSQSKPVIQVLEYGSKAEFVSIPLRVGYEFIGWNTMEDGSGSNWDMNLNTMPDYDVVLYAQWKVTSVVAPVTPEVPVKDLPKTGVSSDGSIALVSIILGIILMKKKNKKVR